MPYFTYILRCRDQSLYTGWTKDLLTRERTHNEGRGGHYTRARCPVKIVYYETFETKNEAMKRECAIKKLRRVQKEALIASATTPLDQCVKAE